MGTFVSIDCLQIHHVSHNMKLIRNSICAVHITGCTGNVKGFTAIVAFHQRNQFWRTFIIIHQTSHLENTLHPKRNFSLHICQFLLYQLICRQGPAKLNTVQSVLTGLLPAEFGSTECAPCNTETCTVQAPEGSF